MTNALPALSEVKVGDVLPITFPIDLDQLHIARSRKGALEAAERSNRVNENVNRARLIMAGLRDRERREADPVERAKTFLRRRGLNVYSATVHDIADDFTIAGREIFTGPELMDFAEARGWRRHG